MSIFAIADLHLAIGVPEKTMEVFGWHHYMDKIQEAWQRVVKTDDLVLLPGDISWAKDALHLRLPGQRHGFRCIGAS